MAASPVLVDSSFYIHMLRQGRDPLRALALTAAARDLAVCGVVRCEVGRGLRELQVLKRFQAFWDVMICVPTDERIWKNVAETLWQLDRKGLTLPLPDVVIGCCARQIGAVVLTADAHFSLIPGVGVIARPE
ncbi:MAG: PIN domain-containing protein [Acidobacteriota bacterium]|jgi:predicted nucleic acid-binding protein